MVGTRSRKIGAIIASATLWACTSLAVAQPANDGCATPQPIAGSGPFNFDTTTATNSGLGLSCQLPGSPPGIARDLWYCWRADCTGIVTVSTCGQTQVDTKIMIYPLGCTCPAPDQPGCCGDDNCTPAPSLQTEVICDVICGHDYLIQVGLKPGTGLGGPGTFTITCAGDPCPPPQGEPCTATPGECCAGRPDFDNTTYATFGSLVTVVTASPAAVGSSVVNVHDIVNPNGGPFNTDFGAPIYSDPAWNEGDLGSVFGVTLDPQGNIYVTATTCYFFDTVGALGTSGSVYKIDTNTGAVSVFANLPNTGPALGNICFDCENDQFFVSNMDDGKIYRLSTAGLTLSTFDFGAPDVAANAFPPLGDRVWAVQAHAGRLYFGVWNEDAGNPSAAANEIWSIALVGGNFSGAPTLEVTMPPNTGANYSNPVSDIRFSPTGTMLVTERGMGSETDPTPHQSRLLEFDCVPDATGVGAWVLGPNNPYSVGIIGAPGVNTAGGVDIDYNTAGRVYATADAMQLGPQQIYGVQGLPWAPGSSILNSVLIDFNGDLAVQDKTSIGDVAVPCTQCMEIEPKSILCEYDPKNGGWTGCFDYTFTVTNKSGVTAQYVLIPNVDVTPNVIPIPLGLANNASQTFTVKICNQLPETTFCFNIVLANSTLQACCSTEHCVDLPDCSCFQLIELDVSCINGNTFRLNFDMQNMSGLTVEHLFFLPPLPPDPLSGMTFNPRYIDIPTLLDGGTTGLINLVVTLPVSPAPGTVICFEAALHDANFATCCYKNICFTVPECPVASCQGDTNNDGFVNLSDLLNVIGAWGPCPPPNPPCLGDVSPTDGDRQVDLSDLLTVIQHWGPCP